METYSFTLRLNREVGEDDVEALYEAGLSDAGIETGPLGTRVDFDREAPSLVAAIVSAVRDIEKVSGLRVVGLIHDDDVTIGEVAKRLDRTQESVRLLALGRRGPGGFPHPRQITPGGEQIFDWFEVAEWLITNMPETGVTEPVRTLVTADRVIAAREALRAEPDEEAKHELEHLLRSA